MTQSEGADISVYVSRSWTGGFLDRCIARAGNLFGYDAIVGLPPVWSPQMPAVGQVTSCVLGTCRELGACGCLVRLFIGL